MCLVGYRLLFALHRPAVEGCCHALAPIDAVAVHHAHLVNQPQVEQRAVDAAKVRQKIRNPDRQIADKTTKITDSLFLPLFGETLGSAAFLRSFGAQALCGVLCKEF